MFKRAVFLLCLILLICVSTSLASLTDGLVAYYPFDGNNLANDTSGNGNNGTVHGATLTQDRFGNSNSAYYFNGVDDFIDAPPVNLQTGESFTVSLWIKYELQPNRIWALYFNSDGASTGFHVLLNTDQWGFHNTQCGLFNGTQNHFDISAYQGQWFHMTTEYDTSRCLLISYLNGVLVDSQTICYFPFQSTGLYIGQPHPWWTGDSFYKGSLDEVRIYNRALSESEIQELYTGVHLPIKPVPSVGIGIPALDYGVPVSWASFPHNGIDYSSSLSDEVKSVGTGIVHSYTKPDASRFGSITPDGRGPAIWVRYKLANGEPIYVVYGHTATSWNDLSSWSKKKFTFNCSYSIEWRVDNKIMAGEQVGFSAPFYHSGTHQEHLHLSVFKPKQKSDGTYYGPPSSGWGYSPLELSTKNDLLKYGALGSYINPDTFFSEYYLSDDIE